MTKSDGAGMPKDPERSLLSLLRESGDALEAASPPFNAAAAASRLWEAARAQGLLRPGGISEANLAVTGAELEEEAPPFDVETGAARLREAARARGLLSSGISEDSAEQTNQMIEVPALGEAEFHRLIQENEAELDRLIQENEELRAKLAEALRGGKSAAPLSEPKPDTMGGILHTEDTMDTGERVRSLAQQTADQAISDARRKPASRMVSVGSVQNRSVTVHRVGLGPKVREIRVAVSTGVQVGSHNRQLNQYQFRIDRPQVSLEHLLKEHSATLRSFEKLVANPHSPLANYAFRRHLPAGPAAPSRGVLFADTSRAPTIRISARVDEYGATVVENSRSVQVGDHNRMRNDFSYKLTRQEISLERMLHDRPDLARGLAIAVRHPDNPAVQRSFTRQISNAYARGGEPSLRILDQDWPGSRLSVEQSVGVQVGTGNIRTDRVSVDIRRLALTGWDNTAERIAANIDDLTPVPPSIDKPDAVPSSAERGVARPAEPPVARPAPGISRPAPGEGRSPGGFGGF